MYRQKKKPPKWVLTECRPTNSSRSREIVNDPSPTNLVMEYRTVSSVARWSDDVRLQYSLHRCCLWTQHYVVMMMMMMKADHQPSPTAHCLVRERVVFEVDFSLRVVSMGAFFGVLLELLALGLTSAVMNQHFLRILNVQNSCRCWQYCLRAGFQVWDPWKQDLKDLQSSIKL